ncbi:MAG: glycoside hydrolase family 3 C-terminal domain-containing protein, partial [Planctomycetales bacterium]|nr:glycoside hydrolase family 3 C-terminal domain-containing protein [Planctomycetales bacterium]
GPAAKGPSNEAPIQRVEVDWRSGPIEERVNRVLALMTLDEKIGQLCQTSVGGDALPDDLAADIRHGRVGSIFYTGSASQTREAQRIAIEESRLGIPLLTPRDVIHGFRTVFPIPLGQAASWNPELIEQAAAIAAREARAEGVNWTFAPMLDISRDARWGRIAESPGEDPLLAEQFACASVRGYQRGDSNAPGIAACGKHFVAYGLSEGGRDYNRAQVAQAELLNVYLRPFKAAADAGCLTMMTGFNTINGVPATANRPLVRGVLKNKWRFDGLVVSDWSSVLELIEHGFAQDPREAALRAFGAGVDMEMATTTYREHLAELLDAGLIDTGLLDDAVSRILRVKLQVALPPAGAGQPAPSSEPTGESLELAKELATQSTVLLKNDGLLPLDTEGLKRVAVLGPLADAARDQLGCWMLDGRVRDAITPLAALRSAVGDDVEVDFVAGLDSPIDSQTEGLAAAAAAAERADVAVVFVGEGWWMNGEARSRVDLNLSGAQSELLRRVTATGTPTVLVCLAGRPLTIGAEAELSNAVMFAWHPGVMGGPAIVDLLLGAANPSGKLPVTFPKHVGQEPLYYNRPATGRPALAGTTALIGSGRADYPDEQKYRSHYIDSDPFPLFPFGFGLSYTSFEYGHIELSSDVISPGQTLAVRATLTNVGPCEGEEVAQLYVRDVAGSLVRPVRELKGFRRIRLSPGESTVLEFALAADDLAYCDNNGRRVLEPGEFRVGVGGDSTVELTTGFHLNGTKLVNADTRKVPDTSATQ